MSKKIDIIKLYLGDYNKGMTGREIAKLTSMNHQTALTYLNNLVDEKILIYHIKGRNKEYRLNLPYLKSRIMVEIAENAKAIMALNNKELGIILPEIVEYSESQILFGSFASGVYDKKSDIDIIVVGEADRVLINRIKNRYSREINIEYVTLKELGNSLKSKKPLALEVLKNHIIFGNVSKIIDIFWRWYKR